MDVTGGAVSDTCINTFIFGNLVCVCYRQLEEGRKKKKSHSGLYTETAILPYEWGKCQGTNWIVSTKGRKNPLSCCLLAPVHAIKCICLGGVPTYPQEIPAHLEESHRLLLKKKELAGAVRG